MSHFRPVELRHASRLLNHGPTVLITSRDETIDRRNVMAAAWSMPVEFEPPRIAIVVDKSAWSRELTDRSGGRRRNGRQPTGPGRSAASAGATRINLTATGSRLFMALSLTCRL